MTINFRETAGKIRDTQVGLPVYFKENKFPV